MIELAAGRRTDGPGNLPSGSMTSISIVGGARILHRNGVLTINGQNDISQSICGKNGPGGMGPNTSGSAALQISGQFSCPGKGEVGRRWGVSTVDFMARGRLSSGKYSLRLVANCTER